MSSTLSQIQEILDQLSMPSDVWGCHEGMADTADFCRHYNVPLDHSANTILVKSKTGEEKYALCVLLAHCRLSVNHTVRKKLGARKVSFATADETRQKTGMEIGGVTPLALPEALSIWVDQQVMQKEYIILGGGNRTSKIKISPNVFDQMPNAEIVEGLAIVVEM